MSLAVAGGEVGLGLRCGALGADSVTHALVGTFRLLPALLVTTLVSALSGTTRTLAGTGGERKMSSRERIMNEPADLHHETSKCYANTTLKDNVYLQTLLGFNLHFLLSAWLAS